MVGPGLITSNADNDAGGIATYAQAGAQFRFKMLWLLVVVTICLIVVNEMSARMGVVTGKGLADLIRERFGVRSTAFAMALLLIANAFTTVAEFAGIAAGMELLGVPKYVSVPIAAIVIWLLVVRGSYPVVERVLLSIGIVYLTYVVSGFLVHPNWSEILRSSVVPQVEVSKAYFLLAIALIGTTITPWMQFYLQAAIAEKGIPEDQLAYSRADVIVGSVVTDVIAFFIVVATALTLAGHLSAAQLGNMQAGDYARALVPVAGHFAGILFGIGLVGASLLAGSVVPLSTSYAVSEAFGFERGVDRGDRRGADLLRHLHLPDRGRCAGGARPRRAAGLDDPAQPGRQRPDPAGDPRLHADPGQRPPADGPLRQQPGSERDRRRHRGGPDRAFRPAPHQLPARLAPRRLNQVAC